MTAALWPDDPRVEADDLAVVLDLVEAMVDRFMSTTDEQRIAIVLWCAHTWATDASDVCAYLFITSAEKRCGKSLLLDIIEQLVCRGRSTANISPAALYRMVDEQKPTLLFDEVDNIFANGKAGDPGKSDLLGLINAGFRKGRVAYRMGGPNMRQLEAFDPFGPKALAGIGGCLPDTTEDRCIPIRLERKARTDVRDRYRIRLHEADVLALGQRMAAAIARELPSLIGAWPQLPAALNDRAQDIWEPLLAIADAAGGDWPNRARHAAVKLHTDRDPAESLATRLLVDIRRVFTTDKILTKDLVAKLNELDESPWGEWRGGQGITSSQLVNRLRPFGVKSKAIRAGDDERGRGFDLTQLTVVFDRYLDDPSGLQVSTGVDTVDNGPNPQVRPVNTARTGGVDASVDAPDQGKRPLVNTVNTVNAGGTKCDRCGNLAARTVTHHETGDRWCSKCCRDAS